MGINFNAKDTNQITQHGLSVAQVEKQLDNFREGFDFLPIDRAAVVGDGILSLDNEQIGSLEQKYDESCKNLTVEKFVPASGAATRMFKELFEFVNEGKNSANIDKLIANIDKFAFWPALKNITGNSSDSKTIVSAIIEKHGLSYGTEPKALILFHSYPNENRTALEEHLIEGALYGVGRSKVRIHFTVSPEHQAGFNALVEELLPKYEQKFGVIYQISYSQQKSGTDTIAVTPDNEPFREEDGSLLFRPAGHGALIENLNAIDADVIFIKTVDNVTTDRLKGDTIRYKKVLAGLLLTLEERIADFLTNLSDNNEQLMDRAAQFIENDLCYKLPYSYNAMAKAEKVGCLRSILDRPVRVCGMVRNEGEPGGGPFWTLGVDGSVSLQIAESSQIAPQNMQLMSNATHFNPVDLVCGVRDYKGKKFDLLHYVDPSTGFISSKSKGGRELKAQELPGLWNGAMANWNTIFVEVPISTFSPVKVVTDLLRGQHQ